MALCFSSETSFLRAQEAGNLQESADQTSVSGEATSLPTDFVYPIAVTVESGTTAQDTVLLVVDLDLPGVWRVTKESKEIYAAGAKQFRKPLNRPRCIALHPQSGILVGDSATREIYHIASSGAEPTALTGGQIGVPMALAVSPDHSFVYVGDAEKKAILRFPIAGGQPEWVARVNARGLAFENATSLLAVTPDNEAVKRIDVSQSLIEKPDQIIENPAVSTVIMGRPFDYPTGLAVLGDQWFVTDSYGKKVWKGNAETEPESWLEGTPLIGPVGIASSGGLIWIADPQAKHLFAIQADGSGEIIETR